MPAEKPGRMPDIFPTYENWANFLLLKGQLPKTKNPPTKLMYKIPIINIENQLEFPAEVKDEDLAFLISQKYENKESKFIIKTKLDKISLSTRLELPPAVHLDEISIMSNSSLIDNRWNNTQIVFMRLKKEYLDKLKAEQIIPENCKNRLWVKYKESTGETTIEIETDEKKIDYKTIPTFLLKPEVLKKICHDNEFDFDIKITWGTLGKLSFNVGHTNPLSLGQYSIWKTLIGEKGADHFIFPVSVYKGKKRVV
jgi:hypothetical protein